MSGVVVYVQPASRNDVRASGKVLRGLFRQWGEIKSSTVRRPLLGWSVMMRMRMLCSHNSLVGDKHGAPTPKNRMCVHALRV